MKRTTIAIEDALLKKLKADAAQRGTTLGAFVNEVLREALASRSRPREFKLKLSGWDAKLQPGVDILDRDSLFDLTMGR